MNNKKIEILIEKNSPSVEVVVSFSKDEIKRICMLILGGSFFILPIKILKFINKNKILKINKINV